MYKGTHVVFSTILFLAFLVGRKSAHPNRQASSIPLSIRNSWVRLEKQGWQPLSQIIHVLGPTKQPAFDAEISTIQADIYKLAISSAITRLHLSAINSVSIINQ